MSDGPVLAAKPRTARARDTPRSIQPLPQAADAAHRVAMTLLEEWQALKADPLRAPPAGRAYAIYREHYLPWVLAHAERYEANEMSRIAFQFAETARDQARTEETAQALLEPDDYPAFFPEHQYAAFHAAADEVRAAGASSHAVAEQAKWASLDKPSDFRLWTQISHEGMGAADILEREALARRAGRPSGFRLEHARSAAMDRGFFGGKPVEKERADAERAQTERAEAERAAYMDADRRRMEIWSATVYGERPGAVPKAKAAEIASAGPVGVDLAAYDAEAAALRGRAPDSAFASWVRPAWTAAHTTVAVLAPYLSGSAPPPESVAAPARATLRAFFLKVGPWATPGLGATRLTERLNAAADASSVRGWRHVLALYRTALGEMDERIAAGLRTAKDDTGAQRLTAIGRVARRLDELHEAHPDALRVDAYFHPKGQIANVGGPGAPRFAAASIPMTFYAYRDGETWHLVDVYDPAQRKENEAVGPAEGPPFALFQQLNSKLRFPEGHLALNVRTPINTWHDVRTTGDLLLSDWLTWIGLGLTVLAGVAAAIPTGGASVAATVLIVSSGIAGAAAGAADLAEKSEQGMLTTTTVVVDVASIVANLAGAAAGATSKIVSTSARGATGGIARLAVAIQFVHKPALGVNIGANSLALLAFTVQSYEQYQEIENSGANDQQKRTAQQRLVALSLLNGAMTLMAIKGDASAYRGSTRLVLDRMRTLTGELVPVARPVLSEPQMRARLKGIGDVDGFIAHLDQLDDAARQRVEAQLSLVAFSGQLASPTVQAVLKGASTQEVLRLLDLVHIDPHAAHAVLRVGGTLAQARSLVLGAEFELARTLVSTKPAALRSALLWQRYPSVKALARQLEAFEQRKPFTPGVLESAAGAPAGWRFMGRKSEQQDKVATVRGGKLELYTQARGPATERGTFVTRYDPKAARELTLAEAFLDTLPKWVTDTKTPLVPGRGTPTAMHLTLYQLNKLLAKAGQTVRDVRRVRLEKIQNLESLVELNWLAMQYPTQPWEQLITKTTIFRYADNTLAQAGLQVVPGSVKVHTKTDAPSFQELLEHYGGDRSELLGAYGFTPKSKLPLTDFDVTFDVVPVRP